MTEFLREDGLLLEVDLVGEVREDDLWSPYFAPGEAQKLYEARKALVDGDLAEAQRLGRLYTVSPVRAAA